MEFVKLTPEALQDYLAEYADLSQKMKDMEERKDEIKKLIENHFGQKDHAEKTEYGSFKMVGRTTYKYSSQVKEAEEDVKMMKKDEEEQGIAEAQVTYSLRFNPSK